MRKGRKSNRRIRCSSRARARKRQAIVVHQTYVLLGTGTVVVLVLHGCEKVHGKDPIEKGFAELGSGGPSLGYRCEALDGGNSREDDQSRGRLHVQILSETTLQIINYYGHGLICNDFVAEKKIVDSFPQTYANQPFFGRMQAAYGANLL
jgi:hypothetical protein